MSNPEHLELIKQGGEQWNWWREENFEVHPNLRGAVLNGADLRGADLHGVDLHGASLVQANLCEASLYGADLSKASLREAFLYRANLSGANLSDACLRHADLSQANLSEVDLCRASLYAADLIESDLSGADLSEADLREANLIQTQVLRTRFEQSIFTGACLKDWNANRSTKFEGVICEYVYLQSWWKDRRPREGTFKQGEFAALFQQVVDTVDLIFKDGIDWQAFFQSFQELQGQYADQDLSIQAIEKKRDGAFIVRLEVAEDADKTVIESSARELYETKLALMEQRYRDVLEAKEGEIAAYREQSTNLMEIIKLQSVRPPMTEIPKYDLRGAQFAGGFAETVQGDQIGGTINNASAETPSLAEAAAEIQNLLKQLEASNPSPTQAQQTAYLDAMIPPTQRERFIGALRAAGGAVIEEVPYGAVLKALVEGWQKPNG